MAPKFRISTYQGWSIWAPRVPWALLILCAFWENLAFVAPSMPHGNLDPSWCMGMNEAVAQGMRIGRDIVFTYGPYASISTNFWHPKTAGLMFWGGSYIALSFTLAIAMVFKLRYGWRVHLALILVLLANPSLRDPLYFFYLLLIAAWILQNEWEQHGECIGQGNACALLQDAGLLALLLPMGLIVLIKGSFVVPCAGVWAILLLYFVLTRRWRESVLTTLAFPLAIGMFWMFAGQPFADLPTYFIALLPIISGYTEAMHSGSYLLEVGAYLVGAMLLLLMLLLMPSQKSITSKWMLALIFFFLQFFPFKAGFVRHDVHALTAATFLHLSTALFILICTKTACRQGRLILVYGKTRHKMTIPVLHWQWWIILFCACTSIGISSKYSGGNIMAFLRQPFSQSAIKWQCLRENLSSSQTLQSHYEAAMAALKAHSNIPPLQGTTDVYSFDQALLFASGAKWNPRPVFQSYSAYTPDLIERNKSHLLASNAPDNLLFKVQPIDGRLPSLEDGASWPHILTRYAPADYLPSGHLLLKKEPKPHLLSETKLAYGNWRLGDSVALPSSSGAVAVKLHIRNNLLGALANALYKSSTLLLHLTLEDGSTRDFRIISGMTQTLFLLSPLVENTIDFEELYAGTSDFSGKRVQSFVVSTGRKGGEVLWNKDYEVEFVQLDWAGSSNSQRIAADPVERLNSEVNIQTVSQCQGMIDALQDQTPIPVQFSARGKLRAKGWLALSTSDGLLPDSVKLILLAPNGERYAITSKQTMRPDLGTHFGNKEMVRAGYETVADVSSLHGHYTLMLGYEQQGTLYICPQYQIAGQIQ